MRTPVAHEEGGLIRTSKMGHGFLDRKARPKPMKIVKTIDDHCEEITAARLRWQEIPIETARRMLADAQLGDDELAKVAAFIAQENAAGRLSEVLSSGRLEAMLRAKEWLESQGMPQA